MAVAALALEQLGFVLDLFPVVGVGRSVLRLRDDGPALRELGIELQELFLAGRHVVLRADRLDGALGLAQRAIDALLGIDDEHVRSFVEAVDGAHLDAIGVLALDTGFRDDEGHAIAPQGAPSGAVRRRRNSATNGHRVQASDLLLGDLDRHTVERRLQDDLTAQAARRAAIEDAAEHSVLLRVGRRQLVGPLRVDINVTGGTRARAAAFGDDAPDVVVDGRFHERRPGSRVDGFRCAVGLNICDPRHGARLPGQYAYAFELSETSAGRL